MSNTDRQQRMAERILEDESLRGDLEDSAATALLDWASQRAARAAADPAQPDDQVEAQVQQIRQAARAAALSGETEPKRLIALAEARMTPAAAPSANSSAVAPAATVAKDETHAGQPPAMRAVGQERAEAPRPATTAADNRTAQPETAPKPASPATNRPRRKRNRLARFLKRLRGGR